MGDFSRKMKNVMQTDFEGKKFLRGNTWRKKLPRMKEKYLSWRIKLEKNLSLLHVRKIILSSEVYEKKI